MYKQQEVKKEVQIKKKNSWSGTSLLRGRRRVTAKKTLTVFFFQSNAHAQGNAPKNWGFPQASKRQCGYGHATENTGGKGCLYCDISSPGLTRTRCRSVGRQGVPSPRTSRRLVAMSRRWESSCSRQNLRRAGTCMDSKMGASNLATSS